MVASNWRRGLVRLWVVATVLWGLIVPFGVFPWRNFEGQDPVGVVVVLLSVILLPALAVLPVCFAVVWAVAWVTRGFGPEKPKEDDYRRHYHDNYSCKD